MLALSATDHVNPVPPRVIVHFFKTPSKAYRFHLQRHLYSGHSPSNPRSEFLPGPRQRTKISLGKTWFCPIGDVIFFFTLGNVNHFSLLPEQRVTGPLEEKRLMLSSTSKCLLILRCYLGQSIFSSFSSSSRPSVAPNAAFPSTADVGRNVCFALKNKMRKKKGKKGRLKSQCLGLFKVKFTLPE